MAWELELCGFEMFYVGTFSQTSKLEIQIYKFEIELKLYRIKINLLHDDYTLTMKHIVF